MLLRLSRVIFFTGLLLLPLINIPQQLNGFEEPKIIFFQGWVEILVLAYSLELLAFRKNKDKKKSYWWILPLIYFTWNWLTSFLGSDFYTSFNGLFWRGQGLWMLAHYLALAVIIPKFLKSEDLPKVGKVFALSGLSVSLYLLITILGKRFFDWPIYTYLGRPVGSFGNPDFLGGFLAVLLPFGFYFPDWLLRICGFLIIGSGIWLSGSRGAGGAVIAGGLIILMFKYGEDHKKLIVTGGILAAVLFTWLFLRWWPVPVRQPDFASSRQRIWGRAVLATLKRPIFGYGLENYALAVEPIIYPYKLGVNGEVVVDKAHNEILEQLVSGGIVGLILWLLIVGTSLRQFVLKRRYLYLGAFLIILIKAQTNVVSTAEYGLFWLFVGLSQVTTEWDLK